MREDSSVALLSQKYLFSGKHVDENYVGLVPTYG